MVDNVITFIVLLLLYIVIRNTYIYTPCYTNLMINMLTSKLNDFFLVQFNASQKSCCSKVSLLDEKQFKEN